MWVFVKCILVMLVATFEWYLGLSETQGCMHTYTYMCLWLLRVVAVSDMVNPRHGN